MKHLSADEVVGWADQILRDPDAPKFSAAREARIREHLQVCSRCLKRMLQAYDVAQKLRTYHVPGGVYHSGSSVSPEEQGSALIAFLQSHDPDDGPVYIDFRAVKEADRSFISGVLGCLVTNFGVPSPSSVCVHDYGIYIRNVNPDVLVSLEYALDDLILAATLDGPRPRIIGNVMGSCIKVIFQHLGITPGKSKILSAVEARNLLEQHHFPKDRINKVMRYFMKSLTAYARPVPPKAAESSVPNTDVGMNIQFTWPAAA